MTAITWKSVPSDTYLELEAYISDELIGTVSQGDDCQFSWTAYGDIEGVEETVDAAVAAVEKEAKAFFEETGRHF